MNHDEACEWKRVDWPQFKEWTDPVTGRTHPAGPYPCHCAARADGRARAERDLRTATNPETGLTIATWFDAEGNPQ